jgi:hypothetical protein
MRFRLAMHASALAAVAIVASAHSTAHATSRVAFDCASASKLTAPHFSANTLRQGTFVYREIAGGKDTSLFTLDIRRRPDGTWRFTGEGSGERWEAIADSAFVPRSAELSLMRRGRPYGFQLHYSGDSVSAYEMIYDSAFNVSKKRSTATIHGVTIDQRIDWASLMASDLAVGQSALYAVYDPATGSSTLTAHAGEGPTLASLSGPMPTVKLDYTICKSGASESYTVFATKELPRVMLREDMRGTVVSELVRMER